MTALKQNMTVGKETKLGNMKIEYVPFLIPSKSFTTLRLLYVAASQRAELHLTLKR